MEMAASYHDAKCGQAFLKDYLAFVEHRVSFDALKGRWITVHPNGKDHEGRPVYVENDGTVKAGLGKKNGINIKELSDNGRTAKANQALQDAMDIAARYGLHIQTCGTDDDYSRYGIHSSGCMTLEILGRANGLEFRDLSHRGMRAGCHCIESRDIGAYDTCINGCRYCYANTDDRLALENYKRHDPDSPLLLGRIRPQDQISMASQKSFLRRR